MPVGACASRGRPVGIWQQGRLQTVEHAASLLQWLSQAFEINETQLVNVPYCVFLPPIDREVGSTGRRTDLLREQNDIRLPGDHPSTLPSQ